MNKGAIIGGVVILTAISFAAGFFVHRHFGADTPEVAKRWSDFVNNESVPNKEDRERLCGDGESAWEFEKENARGQAVQLYFAKGELFKPDRGTIIYRNEGLTPSWTWNSFLFKLEEKDGKRHIKVYEGPPIQEKGLNPWGFDAKGSDPILRYKLEGDTLQLLSGKHGDLDLKGEWKRRVAWLRGK